MGSNTAIVVTRSDFDLERGQYFYTFDNGDRLWHEKYFEIGEKIKLY